MEWLTAHRTNVFGCGIYFLFLRINLFTPAIINKRINTMVNIMKKEPNIGLEF